MLKFQLYVTMYECIEARHSTVRISETKTSIIFMKHKLSDAMQNVATIIRLYAQVSKNGAEFWSRKHRSKASDYSRNWSLLMIVLIATTMCQSLYCDGRGSTTQLHWYYLSEKM